MTYNYTHDRMGNITDKSTEHGDYAYGYDNLYRLTTVDTEMGTEFNSVPEDEAYTYDAVGNRLTETRGLTSGLSPEDPSPEWTYNDNNELLIAAAESYLYDANGNTVKRLDGSGNTVHGYSYDADNRLVTVEDGAGGAIGIYGYDPFGRRLWKEVDGVRTYFLYSDEGLVGEYDAAGNAVKTYGWLPGSTWGTDPLFMAEDGQYYWYLNDHLGTPQKMINNSGQVVWSAVYDAFGMAEVGADSVVENNLRFPGQYWDEETGLHYNWHRYYDPGTGRYITVDPIGFDGGLNLYSYANQNTINLTDPMGLAYSINGEGSLNGPFGSKCGPEGSALATWIPDGPFSDACDFHDKCYSTCGASKQSCDLIFLIMTKSPVYFIGVKTPASGDQFDKAQKEACDKGCK